MPQQQDKHRCEGRWREAKRHQAQQVYHDDIPGMLFADSKAYVGVRDSVHASNRTSSAANPSAA